MILAVAVTLLVAAGSWVAVCALRFRRTSTIVLAWTVLFPAQLIFLVLLSGIVLRSLIPSTLASGAVVSVALEVVLARIRGREAVADSMALVRETIDDVVHLMWRSPVVLALGALVTVQYLWQLALGVRLPQVSYDTLSYHLIAPATWIQQGAIVHTAQNLYADVYPQNHEALTAWLGTYLHSLRYAGITPLPFVLMGAAAVVSIARYLGVRRSLAALAGLGFIAVPALTVQAATGYVDIAAASTVLAALAIVPVVLDAIRVVNGRVQGLIGPLLLAGIAVGLAAGVKSSNLVVVPFVLLGLIVQYVRVRERVPKGTLVTEPKPAMALVLGPILVLAAFWYLRTWATYDNPFYPVTMFGWPGRGRIEDVIIGASKPAVLDGRPFGVLGEIAYSWWQDRSRQPITYDQRLGGFGLQWLYVLFPALVLAGIAFVRRRSWSVLLGVFLPVAAIMFASPAAWWARYTLSLAGIACVSLAWWLHQLRGNRRVPVRIAGHAGAVAFAGLTAVSMWWASDPSPYIVERSPGVLEQLSFRQTLAMVRHPERGDSIVPWNTYRALDDLPPGSVIALTPSGEEPYTYPWVGPELDRELVLLDPATTPDQLAQQLQGAGARYVALRTLGNDGALGQAVEVDRSRFLRRTEGGPLNGADLYELGEWRDCGPTLLAIEYSEADLAAATVRISGSLSDACGMVDRGEVQRWSNATSGTPWQGDEVLEGTVTTGPDGRFQTTFPVDNPDTRYFFRYPGRIEDDATKPAAATRLFTALEAANQRAGG